MKKLLVMLSVAAFALAISTNVSASTIKEEEKKECAKKEAKKCCKKDADKKACDKDKKAACDKKKEAEKE